MRIIVSDRLTQTNYQKGKNNTNQRDESENKREANRTEPPPYQPRAIQQPNVRNGPQVNFNLRENSHHRPNDEQFLLQSGSSFESEGHQERKNYHKGGGQFGGYSHNAVIRTTSQSTDDSERQLVRKAPKRMSSRNRGRQGKGYKEDCEIMSSSSGEAGGRGRSRSMQDLTRQGQGQSSWTTDTTTGTRSRSTERTPSSASKNTISSSSFSGTHTSGTTETNTTDSAQFFVNSSSNFSSSGSSGYHDMGAAKFREQLYARHVRHRMTNYI